LCGNLLAAAGATVVKVEGRNRTDGTRNGPPAFFDWMNSSKLSYAIDFRDDDLRRLLEVADVVIESSRPTSLTRRGLDPAQLPGRPGRVWLRVTGYGTQGERANRVAFGDDAAVAGGLVRTGPAFVGDAIADPLTGLEATLAVLDALGCGGGEVVEIALAQVAASYAALPRTVTADDPPRIPSAAPGAPALGADNDRVWGLIEKRLTAC
jgi:crotonobetainyl-CoA:carnitine CoA-transferase CaiB-like acyl-CoA transferase